MVKYIKCPRCELNYIDEEKQEYCDVCLAEMMGSKLKFADLDDEDYEALDEDGEQTELCPVCNLNLMRYGEKMCEACKKESEYEEEEEVDIEKDEEWKNYIDSEEEGDLTVDDETLQEELDAELEEEEEFYDDEGELDEDYDEDPLDDLEDEDFDDDDDYDDDDDEDF